MSDRTFQMDLPRLREADTGTVQTMMLRAGAISLIRLNDIDYSKTAHTFSTITCGVILSGRFGRGSRVKLGDAPVIDFHDRRPGEIMFNPVGCDIVSENSQRVSPEVIAMNWDTETVQSIDEFSDSVLDGIRPTAAFYDPLIDLTFRTLRNSFSTLQTTDRLFADTATAMILGRLLGYAAQPPRPASRLSGLAPWQLKRVTAYLRDNLASSVSLAELAGLAGLSQAQFGRAFKRSTGLPPHQWQLEQRLSRARQMLVETDLPIQAVAGACGFDDQLYFSRLFRQRLGASPKAWRAVMRS